MDGIRSGNSNIIGPLMHSYLRPFFVLVYAVMSDHKRQHNGEPPAIRVLYTIAINYGKVAGVIPLLG